MSVLTLPVLEALRVPLLKLVLQYNIENIVTSHCLLMNIQTGNLDVQLDTNVQLIWPNRAMLVKLRIYMLHFRS